MAGPPGIEPGTYGLRASTHPAQRFGPPLYLAELRALFVLNSQNVHLNATISLILEANLHVFFSNNEIRRKSRE